MDKPNISIFFPVYNDEKTVEKVTVKAIQILRKFAEKYEIIIIDDCSPDNSGIIAEKLAKQYKEVKVIHHDKNLGYGAALKSGFAHAQYEYICQTDGDDEYEITDMEKFIKLLPHYDLIITFRYVRMYSTWRIFVSKIYNRILRFLFKHTYRDISTGLRFIRKEVIDEIELWSNSPFIGAELAIKTMLKGYRVGEVGIQTFPREFGKGASVSMKNIYLTIKDIIRVYRQIFSQSYEVPDNRKR
ncbi:MAG: glycosyltransferase family 2 protein [Bacteroidales bacterium]|nr:glycosyltransferase family 2 protein [Bacteroidales bacterium]